MPAPLNLPPHERVARDAAKNREYVARFKEKSPATIVYLSNEKRALLKDLVKQTGCFTITDFMNDAFDFYAAHLRSVLAGVAQSETPAEALQIVTPSPQPEALEIPTEALPEPAPVEASEIGTEAPAVGQAELGPRQSVALEQGPPAAPEAKTRRKKAAKPEAKAPRKNPSNDWRQKNLADACADAANRVPVRLEFTWPHHHIPHGMRTMMWSSGLQHRMNVWRGRLRPDHAASLAEQIAKYGGTLEVTGGLGDEPKWTKEEYFGGPGRRRAAQI